MIRRHIDLLTQFAPSERHALHTMRSRIAWYSKTMGPIKPLTEAIRTALSLAEMVSAIDSWIELAGEEQEIRQKVVGVGAEFLD